MSLYKRELIHLLIQHFSILNGFFVFPIALLVLCFIVLIQQPFLLNKLKILLHLMFDGFWFRIFHYTHLIVEESPLMSISFASIKSRLFA